MNSRNEKASFGKIDCQVASNWKGTKFAGIVKMRVKFLKIFVKKYFVLTSIGNLLIFQNENSKKPENQNQPIVIPDMFFKETDIKENCIKLEQYPKHIYFKLHSRNELLRWIKELKAVDGIQLTKEITKKRKFKEEPELEIGKKRVKRWKQKDVLEWINFFSFEKDYSKKFSEINGKLLLEMNSDDLENLGIQNEDDRREIASSIENLKAQTFFNYKEQVVYSKIKKIIEKNSKVSKKNAKMMKSKNKWTFFLKALGDVKELKQRYLNPLIEEEEDIYDIYVPDDYTWNLWITKKERKEVQFPNKETKDMVHIPEDICWSILLFLDVQSIFNFAKINKSFFKVTQNDVFWKEYGSCLNLENQKETQKSWRNTVKKHFSVEKRKKEMRIKRIYRNMEGKISIPVKVLISELCNTSEMKKINSFFSPFHKRNINFDNNEDIRVNISLIVGSWHLEWIEPGLIVPKQIRQEKKFFSTVSTFAVLKRSIDEVSTLLAKLICRWNNTIKYRIETTKDNSTNSADCHSKNSLEFVNECLKLLGLYSTMENNEWKQQLLEKEDRQLVFVPRKEFKKRFGLTDDSYLFSTHKELDEFTHSISKIDNYSIWFTEEFNILRQFDLVFWVRNHSTQSKDEKYAPAQKKCIFGDPLKKQYDWRDTKKAF